MFIAALFTTAKTSKQPKYPSTDEWTKKMWYIYTTEYYSAIKKHEIMPFVATWMDLEIIILAKVSQRQIYDIYVCDLKKTNESICKTETDSQTENKCMILKEEKESSPCGTVG